MKNRSTVRQFICALLALALCGGLAACSSESDAPKSATDTMSGVSAKGKLGSRPEISFDTPFKVKDQAHQIIQKGDGDVIEDGDRVCTQNVALDSKTGKEISSTWDKGKPDCSIVVTKSAIPAYYDTFLGQKVNTTIAIGIDDRESGNSQQGGKKSGQGSSYVMALTIVSKSKDITRAEGDKVKDIPADLPRISLDEKGKPSVDLNNYKPNGKLVSQTLIKGKGAKVGEHQTVRANYTGWLASDGKQFDSSWEKGQATDFSLDQVIKGWQQGLAGHTVGSQVLLIVPPELGYGDQEKSGIPANSTLIFVVDILSAY